MERGSREELLEKNEYDEVCRYVASLTEAPLMHWLLELTEGQLHFDSWLPTVLTLPNSKERICDAVARMANLERGGIPCAGIVEFQTKPDPKMFGRMMLAGGLVWLTVKPTDLPDDRYELIAIVVNLTGHGNCSRQMIVGQAEWTLKAKEVNLAEMDAGGVMDQVETRKSPAAVLVWVSLMKRGDDPVMIQRWSALVAAVAPDPEKRSLYANVLLFAGLVERQELWRKAVEGLQMPRGPIFLEWTAEARREGQIASLLRVLKKRLGSVPEDLEARFLACTDADQLDSWMDAAALATTVEQFRHDVGL